MKLRADIGDEKHEVELKLDGERLFATVDGRSYELEMSRPETGVFLFKNQHKVTEVFVSPWEQNDDRRLVQTGGRSFEIRLIDPKRLRGSGTGGDHSHGMAEIRTVMPGKVVRILKEAGSSVERGEGVMIVEAMKMQNEIKAPRAGVVGEIKVREGGTVAAGDVLAVIE